jgi:hypothetical protein
MVRQWPIPEGLRVLRDGTWCVGELPAVHEASLRYLKSRLVFDEDGAYVTQGDRRLPVRVEGPAFEVVRLVLDPARDEARVVLDDGSEERVASGALRMDEETGRFECLVRGGRARAVLSRGAHQALLNNANIEEEGGGGFFLVVGRARLAIRT